MYDRETVERLIPTLWDAEAVWGIVSPYSPDKDMPKAKADPKGGANLWCMLIDVAEAWRTTELDIEERRAVFLRFALDETQAWIGKHEGVSQSTISRRLEAAVGKMTARMNDEEYIDGYDGLSELLDIA